MTKRSSIMTQAMKTVILLAAGILSIWSISDSQALATRINLDLAENMDLDTLMMASMAERSLALEHQLRCEIAELTANYGKGEPRLDTDRLFALRNTRELMHEVSVSLVQRLNTARNAFTSAEKPNGWRTSLGNLYWTLEDNFLVGPIVELILGSWVRNQGPSGHAGMGIGSGWNPTGPLVPEENPSWAREADIGRVVGQDISTGPAPAPVPEPATLILLGLGLLSLAGIHSSKKG
jgi:hypothetical protein